MHTRQLFWPVLLVLAGCTSNAYEQSPPLIPAPNATVNTQPAIQQHVEQISAEELYEQGRAAKLNADYELMFDSFKAAADAGHSEANYQLAHLYTEGKLTAQDKQAARFYLERSAQAGNPEALRVLAWNTLRGDGVRADIAAGEQMMRTAAQTSTRAQRELGMLYANIYQPHLNNFEGAEHYLRLAANSDDLEAQYQLARLLEGDGDVFNAFEWYSRASDYGHEKAQNALIALQNGENPVAAPVTPSRTGMTDFSTDGIPPAELYQNAMRILTSGRLSLEQEAQFYAMLVIAAERGYKDAQTELSFQSGIKHKLDQSLGEDWLNHAKEQVLGYQ